MRITSLSLASLFLVACRTTTTPSPTAPGPVTTTTPPPASAPDEAGPRGPLVPVYMVEQQVLTEVPAGFDPTGRIRVDSTCSAWDESGFFMGVVPEEDCHRWQEAQGRLSPGGDHRAVPDGSSVRLEGFEQDITLTCDRCRDVEDVAWSPDGKRLAVARHRRKTIEIWSVASRSRVSEVKLDPDGKLRELQLAWPGSLYVLESTLDDRPSCDEIEEEDWDMCVNEWEEEGYDGDPRNYAIVTFADLETAPEREYIGTSDFYEYLSAARLDPWGRCIYVTEFNASMRDDLYSQVVTQPLASSCPIERSEDDYVYDVWRSQTAEWTDGPRPRFMAMTSTFEDDYDGDLESSYFRIRMTELGDPIHTWTQELEEVEPPLPSTNKAWLAMTERELVTARGIGTGVVGRPDDDDGDEQIASAWHHCFELVTNSDGGERRGREWCTSSLDLPRRCEFLDLAPDGKGVLAGCGRGGGTLTMLVDDERVDLKVPAKADWTWGETWLATVEDGSGVVLRSLAAPKRSTRLGPASTWVPTTLGPVLDRVVLVEAGRARVFDAAGGTELASVAIGLSKAVHAAISPSGNALALTDGKTIEVLDLAEGASVKSWSAADASFVAWRQDEAIVFSGPDQSLPTAAWDGRDGTSRPEALPELDPDTLDPTWRWSLMTPNRVKRMVDGLEIWFDETGVLLDDGRFDGEPRALDGVMYRLGEEPFESPMVMPDRMRALMQRKGLAADFFAGRPIEAGPVMVHMEDLPPEDR